MLRAEKLYPTVAKRWLADVDLTKETKRQYDQSLACFQRRLGDHRFAEVTAADVRQFVSYGETGKPRADRTRRKLLHVIWRIYDWALDPEIRLAEVNPASRLRAKEPARAPRGVRPKTWLGEQRALALVATTRAGGNPLDRRDAFLIGLYVTTGLRCAELLGLRWSDVNLSSSELRVVGKGGKMATISLSAPARKLLVGWRSELVAAVGHDDIGTWPLVPHVRVLPQGFRKEPVEPYVEWERALRSPSNVWDIITTRAKAAGIDHVAPHDLRRSFAGILSDRGVPIEDIRRAMRHSHVGITQIYLEDKPKAVTALDDLDFG